MSYVVKVAPNGRVVIPLDVRRKLGLENGGELQLEVTDEELCLRTRLQGLKKARRMTNDMLKGSIWEKRSAVDWLIEERRREVEQESRSRGDHALK